jgi:hypothetical protein
LPLVCIGISLAICELMEPAKLLFQQIAMRENFNNILKTQELKQFDHFDINDDKLINYEECFVNLRDVQINF